MKFLKKFNPFSNNESNQNIRIQMKLKERIGHIGRKMTRGSSDIFRIIKDHAKWGNKQLWTRSAKKNHHKPK